VTGDSITQAQAIEAPGWPPLRDVIARHDLAARRSLGQHFLLDGNLTARIAREAEPLSGRHVIEVGPGPGGLTRALLGSSAESVTVIEVDRRAVAAMHELAEQAGERLRVVAADALRADLTALVPAPRVIVANLPYNIASPLLVGWLRRAAAFEHFTLMFQQEVAERICAPPGSEMYGRLGVLAQWICQTEIVMRLPPTAFVPPPKVWSAVIRLIPLPQLPSAELFQCMEKVTASAFGQRRKMLRSALKALGGEALLHEAEIAGDRRAETLTVAEFERLARCVLARSGSLSP
jgi:16S rRNA (adenine1518-N6/adenine1519-N6)-dimethyltransferase